MQYGLDLTRALLERIRQTVESRNGRLVLFDIDTHSLASEEDETYGLNGKYYRVSKRQFQENWGYVNQGFDALTIPVTVRDWRVSADDGHLNREATDQVMKDLAYRLKDRIGGRAP